MPKLSASKDSYKEATLQVINLYLFIARDEQFCGTIFEPFLAPQASRVGQMSFTMKNTTFKTDLYNCHRKILNNQLLFPE